MATCKALIAGSSTAATNPRECGTGARSGEAFDTVKLLGGKVQASFLDADVKFNADGSYTMAAKK